MKLWKSNPCIHNDPVSISSFLFFIMFPMNMLVWNCRGTGNSRFPGLIKDYVHMYKLSFLALLEPRISGIRVDKVIEKLGFDGIAREEAIGFSGGIWCLWK